MAWNGLVLTVDGRNALNEAQLSGRLEIRSIVVGDGMPPASFRTLKGLVNQLYEIEDLKIDVADGRCTVTADIPTVGYDYYFRDHGGYRRRRAAVRVRQLRGGRAAHSEHHRGGVHEEEDSADAGHL